ncbi:LuxR C-terminal-related transcriptional regulator [uncultured Duncaniella sp.]|uniref:LuxR C-terminal-related transcriptional regulator n=1 Tax=uncultured Duncaniella sp. TaxID=2768039 RepID=UPI0026DFACF0|nr:LuxR C-terminal-related transcriptional regulator [uncultured Duncaniella sp.]
MNDSNSYQAGDKMRDLVRNNSELILVMGRFDISLGFGDKTVREVCRTHHVDEKTFLAVVNYVAGRDYRFEDVSLSSLIRYLKQSHEYFLDFNLPNIRRKLIEAVDCSDGNDIAMLIIRFYDEYVQAVRKHMEYENETVFSYVEQLSQGHLKRNYTISEFASKHAPIGDKLKELKDVIIRCYPEKNNYLLNAALLEIISCEQDLTSHCMIEDKLFVPAVKLIEQQLREKGATAYADKTDQDAPDKKDKLETLSDREKDIVACVTKGMSNKEIAEELYLSVHTVTTHRRNISNKLQIHTTAGLTIYAIANKLVNIEEIQVG